MKVACYCDRFATLKGSKRQSNAVFPDDASVIRLAGSVLMEISDEWQAGRRYLSEESMRSLIEPEPVIVAEPAPLRLAPVH